ncbi:MAG: PAS domain S-box protein [Anaerolineales bacterium]|nr:PAS domain S-box protein [Anaerolineales bacterium]
MSNEQREQEQLTIELEQLRQRVADLEQSDRILKNKIKHLELALDAAAIAAWDWDIINDRIFGDENLAVLFGFDNDLVSKGLSLDVWKNAIHEEDRPYVDAYIEQSLETGARYAAEYRVLDESGACRWLVAHGQVEFDEMKPVRFHGIVSDITLRKQAEQKLLESEARFSEMFKQSPYPVSLLRETDAIYIEVNDAWRSFYGFSKEQVLDRSPVELGILDQDSLSAVQGLFLRDRNVKDFETTTRTRDGDVKDILSSLSPIQIGDVGCVLNITVDISERKRAIEELEKTKDLFSKAFHGSPAPMAIALVKKGTYIEVNDSFLRMFELDRQEVIGRVMGELNLIDRESLAEIKRQMLRVGEIQNLKIRARSGSGKELRLLSSIENAELAGRECMIATLVDITELEETMEALRESQAFNETLLNASPNNIYIYDLEEKRNVYSNESIFRILGYSVDEVQELDDQILVELLHPDDFAFYLEKTIPQYPKLADGEFMVNEYRLRAKNGDWRRISFQECVFMRNELGEPKQIFGIGSDITERVKVQEALRSSELFLNSIIEQSPYAMWISDEKGTLIRLNQACRDLLNITDEDVVGRYNVFEDNIVHEQGFMPQIEKVFEQGITADFHLKYDSSQLMRNKPEKGVKVILDVTIFPIKDANGKITNAIIQHRDVTEQEFTKRKLQEREELLTEMSHIAKVGAWEYDVAIDKLTWTEEIVSIFELEQESDLNLEAGFDFFFDDSGQKIKLAFKEAIEQGRPFNLELEIITAKGTHKWVRVIGYPVKKADHLIKISGTTQDITQRKQAEIALKELSENLQDIVDERTRELEDAQERLVRQEKLAMLGQLAGGIGHELRNPLGAISNSVYFLKLVFDDQETEPEVVQVMEILESEIKKAENIIRTLLDYARSRPPVRRKVKLDEVIRDAMSSVSMPEDLSLEVVIQLDDSALEILADHDQLVQIMNNILQNAVQAMSPPYLYDRDGRLQIKTTSSPGWIKITVSDTGVGIPPENLDKLFEPLFTTRAKGIGLGLAVVKMLVDGHDGRIEVESENVPGKGATFTVWLPMEKRLDQSGY